MSKQNNYLLLDKDDITKVCGVISSKDILKEISRSQFNSLLTNGKLFRDKYILVEKDYENSNDTFENVKFDENKKKYFYASRDGEFFTINKKTGKKVYIKKFLHQGLVKIKGNNNKDYLAKNLIAQIFLGAKKGDVVEQKNNDLFDCSVENLRVIPCREYYSQIGINKGKKIGMFEDGELVRTFNNISECAKELHYTKRNINYILNNEYKAPVYDLRYMEKKK